MTTKTMTGFIPAKVRVTGYPYVDRSTCEAVSFGRDDVRAFGLLCAFGDNVNRYMVELKDGRTLLLRGVDQPKDDLRWLRKLAKSIRVHLVSREVGWASYWTEVASSASQKPGRVDLENAAAHLQTQIIAIEDGEREESRPGELSALRLDLGRVNDALDRIASEERARH